MREAEETGDLLVLSFDGKGIAMRHADLRDATRKKAEGRCSDAHAYPVGERREADGSCSRTAIAISFERAAQRVGVKITIVLDVVHVLEYVWTATYAFHAAGTNEAETWVENRFLALLKCDRL